MNQVQNLIASQFEGKNSTKISRAELSLILQKIDGSSATSFWMVIETEPKLKKTGNPFAGMEVRKLSKYEGMINMNYTNSVNNQREREGMEKDFQAQSNWHTKKYDSFNGCVACKVEGEQKSEYLFYKDNNVERLAYTIDGKIADETQTQTIKMFLPAYSPAKNQGTEVEIKVKTVKLQNIRVMKVKGELYEVID